MWIWIIIGACVIGAIIGLISSDGDNAGADAAGGAFAGGCMAAGCIFRILLAAFGIFIVIWLFGFLFG